MMTKRLMTLDSERGDCSFFRDLYCRIRKFRSSYKKLKKRQLDLQVTEG